MVSIEGVLGSPAVGADGTIYLPVGRLHRDTVGYLYAINPDGTLRWRLRLAGMIPSLTTPAIGPDGMIYVHGNGDEGNTVAIEKLHAITPDGTIAWTFLPNGSYGMFTSSVQSSPVVGADGTIYVGWMNTYLFAINPDGTMKWAVSPSSSICSSPALAPDGTIDVVDGELTLDFIKLTGDPQVNAIQIRRIGGYRIWANPGATLKYTDTLGISWQADRPFTTGSWGYVVPVAGTRVLTTTQSQAIANTPDPTVYRTARQGMTAYKFSVPIGAYTVVLKFAELKVVAATKRVFDVRIEGVPRLTNYDVWQVAGGRYIARDETFTDIVVNDGILNINFTTKTGEPMVSAIEVRQQ